MPCLETTEDQDVRTVAALYERRRFGRLDIVGGHRPPLQFKEGERLAQGKFFRFD
jgi:hypothetical protein